MPSLVEELQRDALNHKVAITELLQKCLVVAIRAPEKSGVRLAILQFTKVQGRSLKGMGSVKGMGSALDTGQLTNAGTGI